MDGIEEAEVMFESAKTTSPSTDITIENTEMQVDEVHPPEVSKSLTEEVNNQGGEVFQDPGNSDPDLTSQTLLKNLEQEARNDLVAFLRRKGIADDAADKFKINVSLARSKSRQKDDGKRKSEPSSMTTYTAPDGSMLTSKTDVMNAILQQNSVSSKDFSSLRNDAHEEAKLALADKTFPFTANGITVLNLGEIDTRSGFHSATQLWPSGYRCKQVVEGSTLNGVKKQEIICQIGVSEAGFPQFHIYVPSTEATYIASSEANVWRRVLNVHLPFFSCGDNFFPCRSSIHRMLTRVGIHPFSISPLS